MFGIFVHYSTRPIYDVSMNLFCWPPSVDILNILPGFLWQPLLNLLLEQPPLKLLPRNEDILHVIKILVTQVVRLVITAFS